jgi:hypothetical protein
MYITGNIGDYQSRLHQLPLSGADLTGFITEGKTYFSVATSGLYDTWRRELALKNFQINKDVSYYTNPPIP